MNKTCKMCGKEFADETKSNCQKYCSAECRYKFYHNGKAQLETNENSCKTCAFWQGVNGKVNGMSFSCEFARYCGISRTKLGIVHIKPCPAFTASLKKARKYIADGKAGRITGPEYFKREIEK